MARFFKIHIMGVEEALDEVTWRVQCGCQAVTITRVEGKGWQVTNTTEEEVDQEDIP